MSLPRVCILTSGIGSRMGPLAALTNKALLPLAGKAILSRIIEKFPFGTTFTISLGHLGDQVRAYLSLAHPNITFHYCQVDRYEGAGSGPAYSLLCCRDQLPGPFYFVSCDTLWDEPFDLSPATASWFASAKVAVEDLQNYCCFEQKNNKLVAIVDKQKSSDPNLFAFSGLCYIADPPTFWKGLEQSDLIQNERQISNGIRALVAAGSATLRLISWIDVGAEKSYRAAVKRFDTSYDFSKTDELLYFVDSRVIKFFRDTKITERRYKRAQSNPAVFPVMLGTACGFYAYDMVPGRTLFARNNVDIFRALLTWLKTNLWKPRTVETETFRKACHGFYQVKTMERVAQFQKKYGWADREALVNNQHVTPLQQDLQRVPWSLLQDGQPVFFHGDLQFDNILLRDSGLPESQPFCLIDWRQDFAGHVDFGDIYYDLAKLLGGIGLNYDYIKQNLFDYQELGDSHVFIDWASRTSAADMERVLFDFVEEQGLSPHKVRLLTALIYLNMSPLHNDPFDKLLHYLGRRKLADALAAL